MTREGILLQLFSAFPNVIIKPETVAMYDRLLADIPEDALQDVVDISISSCKFLPTIAELRETWLAATKPAVRSWVEAWDEVNTQMRKVGWVGTPKFSDELTASIVKSFGWRALCASENPDIVRAQFRQMYEDMAKRAEADKRILPQTLRLGDTYGNGAIGGTNGFKRLTGD